MSDVSVVGVVVCPVCGDLVGWFGCTYEQAMDYLAWDLDCDMMDAVPDKVLFSDGSYCGSCRGDYDAKGA